MAGLFFVGDERLVLRSGANVTATIVLRPGLVSLSDWRAIYRGARIALDPIARADVEAGAAALAAILAEDQSISPPDDDRGDEPEATEGTGRQPAALTRLFTALKLASLARGFSGVRWEVVDALAARLDRNLLPSIPANDATDRVSLSFLLDTLTGAGEIMTGQRRMPADEALEEAGLTPVNLTQHEKQALVSGTQFSTALALAGLFEAERVLQSAIVVGALAAPDHAARAWLHPRVQEINRHDGQAEVAAAMRELLATCGEAARQVQKGAGSDDISSAMLRLGACLGLLRQAGETLRIAANAVTETRVVLWQSEEIITQSGDISPVLLATELIAMALREIANVVEQQIAPDASRAEHAAPDGGRDAGGASRLLPIAGDITRILAQKLLAMPPDPELSQRTESPAASARRRLAEIIPLPHGDGHLRPEALVAAVDLVRSGTLAGLPGVPLPSATPSRRGKSRSG